MGFRGYFLVLLTFLSACGSGEVVEPQESTLEESPGEASGVDQEVSGDLMMRFRDTPDFTLRNLDLGQTNCAGIGDASSFAGFRQWPDSLKGFLAGELAKFPEQQMLLSSVAGFYLVEEKLLDFGSGVAVGLTCDDGVTGRIYVFLSYEEFVSRGEQSSATRVWKDYLALIPNYTVAQDGDQAVVTVLHEVFHAIDLRFFILSDEKNNQTLRNQILDLAWNDAVSSKYQKLDTVVALQNMVAPPMQTAKKLQDVLKQPHIPPESRKYFLQTEPDILTNEYKYLAEKTNFITPYAAVNAFEDFADTLTRFYMMKVYSRPLVRSVYSTDISTGMQIPSDSSLLYRFDSKALFQNSAAHKEKVCLMQQAVFQEWSCHLQAE